MDKNKLLKRDTSLDIIRLFAFFCVVCVHFFMNSGLYYVPVSGIRMYIVVLMRTFFMCCVPLFMILSGYLLNKKELSKHYYLRIFEIINVYILASIACIFYWKSYDPSVTFMDGLKAIFNFSAAPYSWYIEMYIGLFLLIPFLNIIYKNLKNQKQKIVLVFTFILLTVISNMLNFKYKIFISSWTMLSPIMYYYVGCYLKEYPIKVKNIYLVLVLLIHLMLSSTFIYFDISGQEFPSASWSNWHSYINFMTSILVFSIIKNINTLNWNIYIKEAIKYLSSLSLGAYLVSWIFDSIFYSKFNTLITSIPLRLNYFIIIVIIVSLSSLLLSALINLINSLFFKIIYNIKNIVQNRKTKEIKDGI